MRNPERISRILQKLQIYWEKNPDLRLGQIVVNAKSAKRCMIDVFYMEDEAFEEGLEELTKSE